MAGLTKERSRRFFGDVFKKENMPNGDPHRWSSQELSRAFMQKPRCRAVETLPSLTRVTGEGSRGHTAPPPARQRPNREHRART